MTETQAKAEALRLAGEGATCASIAEHLKAKGYASPRTGKPITRQRVNQMLRGAGHRTYRKRARKAPATVSASERKRARKAPATTSVDKLSAVKSILCVSSMPADERIAFALLMIGGSK